MNKKQLTLVFTGVLAAAVICIAVGLIIYYVSLNSSVPADAPNFGELNAARSAKILTGLVIICVGAASSLVPLVALIVLLIAKLITKFNDNN